MVVWLTAFLYARMCRRCARQILLLVVSCLSPNYLGPIQTQPKFCIWKYYSQHTLFPRGGCTEQQRPVQTKCNVSFPHSRESLPNGSTNTHFYIKGNPRSSKGRISLIYKPSFMTSTDLSVCR